MFHLFFTASSCLSIPQIVSRIRTDSLSGCLCSRTIGRENWIARSSHSGEEKHFHIFHYESTPFNEVVWLLSFLRFVESVWTKCSMCGAIRSDAYRRVALAPHTWNIWSECGGAHSIREPTGASLFNSFFIDTIGITKRVKTLETDAPVFSFMNLSKLLLFL